MSRKQKESLLAKLRQAESQGLKVKFPGSEIPVAYQYRKDIPGFCSEILHIDPRPTQKRMMRELVDHKRICIRSPRGYGKTALAAWIVLWALTVFPDVKVITTASAWQQLTTGLWPEIARWAEKGHWERLGIRIRQDHELTSKKLQLSSNRFAYAVSSKEPHRIEGTHAEVVVCVIDEAKAVPNDIWDAVEGSFIGCKDYYFIAISTPGVPQGRFYDIHRKKKGFEDWTPFWITHDTAVQEQVPMFEDLARKRARQWGVDSPFYKQQFLAEFAEDEENALIPLSWVEKSNLRWANNRFANMNQLEKRTHLSLLGMDVGGEGTSQTVIARMYEDHYIGALEKHKNPDTNKNIGYLRAALTEGRDKEGHYLAPANVDAIGIGVGVSDWFKEHPQDVRAVNVSKPSRRKDRTGIWDFANLRSELWWRLRERLDPSNSEDTLLDLPPDDDLTGELVSVRYTAGPTGIKVESKQQTKKRLGHSPDHADSIMLLMYTGMRGSVKINQNVGKNPFYA